MSTYLKNIARYKHNQLKKKSFDDIHKLFNKAMKMVNTFVDMDTELVEGSEVRAEEEDKETTKLQRLIEVVSDKEEVAIDAIPLETKPPSIVECKIHKEGKKTYYQIIRADGSSKMYLVFSHMLKIFDREDLETLLLEVLRNHKGAIAWSIADIKGIDSSFCTHKILMEDEFKPTVQPQRRVNPNVKEVVKKEVIKLLYAGLIYPISDSPWVSPVQVVPKKGGMTVVKNKKDELVPQQTVTGWRIPIALKDKEKTTFTCPYGTFAYKQMPFGLCNAPTTFQRCMTAIFHELIEDSMEVFMDDFSVFGSSFDHCLKNLEKMLERCEETNLMLNWEKCHFMVKEGIVLGHKVLGSGIEVDKAKIEAISKLPYPTNVKAI
ncbi:reverse transcriptase domain-containing protein [Tanacetum coccineum]